jgi:hypothetical protein
MCGISQTCKIWKTEHLIHKINYYDYFYDGCCPSPNNTGIIKNYGSESYKGTYKTYKGNLDTLKS